MPIEWRPGERQMHLYNEHISYVMRVLESGTLAHLYLGPRLATARDYGHFVRSSFVARYNQVLDPIPRELPTAGSGDFRLPGLAVRHADGSTVLELVYREHTISAGKPATEDWVARASVMERGGDELMSQGLFLDDHAWESQARGDFQARVFELQGVIA